jgi:hypothetical protein
VVVIKTINDSSKLLIPITMHETKGSLNVRYLLVSCQFQ